MTEKNTKIRVVKTTDIPEHLDQEIRDATNNIFLLLEDMSKKLDHNIFLNALGQAYSIIIHTHFKKDPDIYEHAIRCHLHALEIYFEKGYKKSREEKK